MRRERNIGKVRSIWIDVPRGRFGHIGRVLHAVCSAVGQPALAALAALAAAALALAAATLAAAPERSHTDAATLALAAATAGFPDAAALVSVAAQRDRAMRGRRSAKLRGELELFRGRKPLWRLL